MKELAQFILALTFGISFTVGFFVRLVPFEAYGPIMAVIVTWCFKSADEARLVDIIKTLKHGDKNEK